MPAAPADISDRRYASADGRVVADLLAEEKFDCFATDYHHNIYKRVSPTYDGRVLD